MTRNHAPFTYRNGQLVDANGKTCCANQLRAELKKDSKKKRRGGS